ncbi:hypothetical protein E2C01_030127 [Portunus trituberculatus]|uniref:Uncharacterized protein n=1 Tax=Portunus trituberculatus TaxID=210409 RepID=A0A5B7EPN1_PORTR|nr:hypothetical protein [Portunus trituberculatus]
MTRRSGPATCSSNRSGQWFTTAESSSGSNIARSKSGHDATARPEQAIREEGPRSRWLQQSYQQLQEHRRGEQSRFQQTETAARCWRALSEHVLTQ